IPFEQTELSIHLGDFVLMSQGTPQPFDRAAASAYLKQQSERSTHAMSKILLSSTQNSNALINPESKQPITPQALGIEALAHPVKITASVGTGAGNGTAWGCDLSYDYVKINAEYTT
ncbi:MAG: bifunctional ornithine acetyltransferase/N-acetylglutamate synthase, partial [Cyanobacteria bacterium J06553_1]